MRTKDEMLYETYLLEWFGGIESEIAFWKRFMEEGSQYYGEDIFRGQVRSNKEFTFEEYFSEYPEGELIKYVDVGSGPFSRNGIISKRVKLEAVAVDPLADIYNELKKTYNLENGIDIQPGFVELLDLNLEENKYDVVHMSNALDHSFDPVMGIYQLLRICKIGGKVILRHHENEAENENYNGFHRWNLSLHNDEDTFVIWNQKYRYNICDLFSEYADISFEKDVLEDTGWMYNTVIMKKRKDIIIPDSNYRKIFINTLFKYQTFECKNNIEKKENIRKLNSITSVLKLIGALVSGKHISYFIE